ncbi:DUF397 domain-containing protein, partial [Thermobifida fusca]
SSYSGVNNYCVEVADLPGATAVRDSKHPEAGVLRFPSAEWVAFLRMAQEERH